MAVLNFNKKYFANIEWAASKSVDDFVAHERHTDNMTEAELREVHGLCVQAVTPPVEAPAPSKQKEKEK